MTTHTAPADAYATALDRLRRMVQRYPTVSGYRLNPDASVVDGIVRGLARSQMRYGHSYCPCRDLTGDPQRDRANVCPCAWHHEEIRRDSHCRCQLFVGEGYDPALAYAADVRAPVRTGSAVVRREVTLYVTSWCFLSRRTRALLDQQQVAYRLVDVEQDAEAALEVEAWNGGFRSVPTVVIGLVIHAPQPGELQRILVDSRATVQHVRTYVRAGEGTGTLGAWLADRELPNARVDVDADGTLPQALGEAGISPAQLPALEVSLRLTEPPAECLLAALGL